MAVLYTPHFMQFFDNNGNPLAGGKLYTYAAGTTTPKASYTTAAGNIENANPIILDAYGRATLFIEGAYRFDLFTSADVLVKSTDNITSFNASTATNEGFFQSFSGTGAQTAFTLSEDLGTDEKALFVFAETEYSTNGTFASDTGWTKGAGWTIAAGVATATGAISTALEQSAGITLVQGKSYSVQYTITRSAGSITLSLGGTAGAARSASGTYAETIIAGSTQTISFGTSGFTGTLDNVSIRDVTGPVIKNPNTYTVNGTALTFATAPASGTNNIFVFAPYTLIGAAGAAQVAADAAIAAQAAAELAETNAEAAEAGAEAALAAIEGLTGTSTTSLAIGTGGKSFTTQAGLGFTAGMWILATRDADPTNYMHGYVSSYSGTTLLMVATNIGGSGTHADWTIRLSGTQGATGATGSASAAGGSIAVSGTASEAAFITLAEDTDNGTNTIKVQAPASVASNRTVTFPDATGTVALTSTDAADFTSGAATDGQVLTADGAGGAAWETLNVSSGWVPIKTVTASNVSSVDFVNGSGGVVLDGTYKSYVVVINSAIPITDTAALEMRTSSNGGSSFDSGGSDYDCGGAEIYIDGSVAVSPFGSSSVAQIRLTTAGGTGNQSGENCNVVLQIFNPSVSQYVNMLFHTNYVNPNPELVTMWGSARRRAVAIVDGIRFYMSSGNISSGTFTLYGLASAP